MTLTWTYKVEKIFFREREFSGYRQRDRLVCLVVRKTASFGLVVRKTASFGLVVRKTASFGLVVRKTTSFA